MILEAIIEKEHEVLMNSKQTHNYVQFGDKMVIKDLLDNDDEVIECYCFRKYDKLLLPDRNFIHFETGLLLLLFCLARNKTLKALTYFFDMMYQISTLYVTDIFIWRDYIPMLN
jgi:hypothetical protein